MSSNDDTRPDEMTDTELDQLLAAANRELLSHIEATADPHRPLIAIMTRGTQETYPSMTATPAVRRDPGLHPAAVMITMRVRVRDLVILLNGGHDLSLNGVPDDTRIRARALARVLVRDLKRAYPDDREPASALARALAQELVRDLDSDPDPDPDPDPDSAVSALALQVARALARTYSDNLESVFSSAREVARALAHILDAQQVDASDAGRRWRPGRLVRCPPRNRDVPGLASLLPAARRAPRPARPGRRRPRSGAPGKATARPPRPGCGSRSPRRGPIPAPTSVPVRPAPAATRPGRPASGPAAPAGPPRPAR